MRWLRPGQSLKLGHGAVFKAGGDVGGGLQMLKPGQCVDAVLALDQDGPVACVDADDVRALPVVVSQLTSCELETDVADVETGNVLLVNSIQTQCCSAQVSKRSPARDER